jgi:plasmid segregation protein ParM
MDTIFIAADVGRSSVKVRAADLLNPQKRFETIFPSAAIPAFELSDERTRQVSEADTVSVHGQSYFFGQTARIQGEKDFIGESDAFFESHEHDALLVGAIKRVKDSQQTYFNVANTIVLVMGVPQIFIKQKKDKTLVERVTLLLKSNSLTSSKSIRVIVAPQARGPIYQNGITCEGKIVRNEAGEALMDNETYACVEIGHQTTDFTKLESGQVAERSNKSDHGVNYIYKQIEVNLQARGIYYNAENLEKALLTKKIGKADITDIVDSAITSFNSVLVSKTNHLFGEAPMDGGIILAGGGAPLIYEALKESRKDLVVMPENPRFAVAEGLLRYGIVLFKHQQKRAA